MQCPVCVTKRIYARDIETDLIASTCETCSGTFISHANFQAWRAKHPGDQPEQAPKTKLQVDDIPKAKVCPQCGRLMLRYQVGHQTGVVMDHCGGCGGMWLDKGEWDALRQYGLHDNLFHVLTTAWQADVRRQAIRTRMDKVYESRLGAETFSKVKDFRDWMEKQSAKALISSYIADALRKEGGE